MRIRIIVIGKVTGADLFFPNVVEEVVGRNFIYQQTKEATCTPPPLLFRAVWGDLGRLDLGPVRVFWKLLVLNPKLVKLVKFTFNSGGGGFAQELFFKVFFTTFRGLRPKENLWVAPPRPEVHPQASRLFERVQFIWPCSGTDTCAISGFNSPIGQQHTRPQLRRRFLSPNLKLSSADGSQDLHMSPHQSPGF